METFKNLIGGEWVGASDHASFETRNPARSDEVLGTFPSATATACAESAAVALGKVPSTSSLRAGLRVSKLAWSDAPTHSPPMRFLKVSIAHLAVLLTGHILG